MEVTIQAIKFSATDKLREHIDKKLSKLEKFYDRAMSAEVTLKVTKPEAANNKEALINLNIPSKTLFASKVADTFEQAIDECILALEKQLEKEKNR